MTKNLKASVERGETLQDLLKGVKRYAGLEANGQESTSSEGKKILEG